MKVMSLHSIPPLISTILLFTFFLVGLLKAREKKENILFSLVCLLGFFLNLDKTLLTFVEDATLALKISRLDHLFLVFIVPLYLHFSVSVSGEVRFSFIYRIFYVVALLMMPLTQTDYYLKGVRKFFFGFFAQAGPLFYFFSILSIVSVLLSLAILIFALRSENTAKKRTKIKYVILSIGIAACINHFDVLVMAGYEIYPLGNFVFLPMALLGYAIYKHDILEWKLFLNRGLQFFILFIFSMGVFLAFFILGYAFFGKNSFYPNIFFALALTLAFILALSDKIRELIVNFTLKEEMEKRRALKELSFSVLKIESANKIKDSVLEKLEKTFGVKKCAIEGQEKGENKEAVKFFTEGDPHWEEGYRLSLFIPSEYSPSVLLLGEKKDMSLYTEEELELLSILANNLALAMDNAYIYKELKDLTKSLERMVEERTKALIKSESLAAIGRLAAGVAHELNNPLASVMSTLEYQLSRMEEKGMLYEDLSFCLKELKRAEGIVKSLLFTARQKDEERGAVDVHRAMDDALRVLFNEYKRKPIEIKKSFNASNPIILGVHARLCQVFINLIKNSIEALEEKGGTIELATENSDDGSIKVIVEDSGPGMDEEVKANLFLPFFTTKPQGVGLGLYITYEIVKDHGGKIELISEKGKGTRFIISFPVYQQRE